MASANMVVLMGNLTRDPELRHTQSGMAVCGFGLAVNEKYKTKDGESKEDVVFIDCNAWGRTAEIINQYLSKGSGVHIIGKIRYESWNDTQGNKRSKHSVTVQSFQFIGSKQTASNESAGQRDDQQPEPDEIPF
jgi:single-strand DNA-binding protein